MKNAKGNDKGVFDNKKYKLYFDVPLIDKN